MISVYSAADRQAARPQASFDLILDTRAGAVAENHVRASAQRKDFADDVDRLAQAVGRTERAEVLAAVAHDFARDHDAGPWMVGHLGAQVRLVVLEPDVVA